MRALVTGAAGQDGTILSTVLQRNGDDVVGLVKPGTNTEQFLRYASGTQLIECDLADVDALRRVVVEVAPDHIYNFGGISSIMESVNNPELTERVNVDAVRSIVAAMKQLRAAGGPNPKLVEAASGTVFEDADRSPQTETSAFAPSSPYARSKAAVISLLREERQENGLFAASAILYNHESPLRGEGFVTRKITRAVARIARGLQDDLELGDIDVARDWGWAPDYVQGMRMMALSDRASDYVLATGISHRLSFFIRRAFESVGIADWRPLVRSAEAHTRPIDTNILVGDSRKAYTELGWRHTVDFDGIVRAMVQYDTALLDDPAATWTIP